MLLFIKEKAGRIESSCVYVYKQTVPHSITGSFVALKEIRLEHEEGAPCTAIREGLPMIIY